MAKYSKASEEIEELVNDIANELNLVSMGVDFQPLCVNKAKEVVKIVKANELAEYASNREDLVFVLCYEEAFDAIGFDEEAKKNKYWWIRTAMEEVSYDTEKCKMVIGCPKITIPVGLCGEMKGVVVNAALLGQYTIASIEQKKKEEAEQRKALKKQKGGKKNY